MWLYIAIGFFIDLSMSYILKPLGYSRSWLGNLYMLTEFLFISLYFKSQLIEHSKKYFDYFIALIALIYISRTVSNSIFTLNLLDGSVIHLTYIIYGISGLYIILKEQKILQLETSEQFWANVSFLIYFAGNFILFLFYDLVKENEELYHYLWAIIHLTLNVLYRILLAVALTRKND